MCDYVSLKSKRNYFSKGDSVCILSNVLLNFMGGGGRGGAVFKVLCYKSEGRSFDPSWGHWNFSLI